MAKSSVIASSSKKGRRERHQTGNSGKYSKKGMSTKSKETPSEQKIKVTKENNQRKNKI